LSVKMLPDLAPVSVRELPRGKPRLVVRKAKAAGDSVKLPVVVAALLDWA
jgi:hypothetical protein